VTDYMRPDEAREIYHELMSKEQAARQRDKDEGRDYGNDELISNLYQRIAELKTEIAMLMDERDKAEKQVTELTGALWNSTRNMQDIVKYGEKACNADFKAAIARNRKALNAREGE
jgi:predicted  nucleic acid-binding Zn-ribbon protein